MTVLPAARSLALGTSARAVPRTGVRGVAALATHPSAPTYTRKGVQVTEAPLVSETTLADAANRSVVIHETSGPLSSLAFAFKAGSRFEDAHTFGAAHMWKNSLIRNSVIKPINIVHTVRDTELRGATLWTAHTREEIIIGTDFMRDDLPDALFSLLTHVTNKQFLPYEFYENGSRTIAETEAASSDLLSVIYDKLHAIAFRNGLGNHLFATEGALNHLSRDKLKNYASKFFIPAHTGVVGVGINPRDFTTIYEDFAAVLPANSAPLPTVTKTKYHGGEYLIDQGPGSSAILALALPSVSFSDPLYPAHLVLRGLLDGEMHSMWGTQGGVSSILSKVGTETTKATAIEASYSDAGLIGFIVSGKDAEIGKVAKAALDAIKKLASSSISDAELARAQASALVELEQSKLSRQNIIHEISRRAVSSGAYSSILSVPAAIKKVSAADIKKLAAQAINATPSVVISGNTTVLPRLSDFA